MLDAFTKQCLLTLGAKEGKEKRDLFFCCSLPTPCCLLFGCLAWQTIYMLLICQGSDQNCHGDQIFKIGFSHKIQDLCESLCPRIASAGQPCGFSVGRNCFVFVWSD